MQTLSYSCKNTLVFTTLLLGNTHLFTMHAIIVELTGPIESWHSSQNKLNRSAVESVEFHVNMAVDKGFDHINEVLDKLRDMALFEKGPPDDVG